MFGLLIAHEPNWYTLERLVEGLNERSHIDNPRYSPKSMFTNLSFDHSNEELIVQLPQNAEDLDDYCHLNPNDVTCMIIRRDYGLSILYYFAYSFTSNMNKFLHHKIHKVVRELDQERVPDNNPRVQGVFEVVEPRHWWWVWFRHYVRDLE